MRTLTSRSLHLQKVKKEDLPRVNDLRKIFGTTPLEAIDVTERQLSIWMIVDRKTNQDLGAISLAPNGEDGAMELGFAIVPEARGKGILSSVLPPFVRYLGFTLFCETNDTNRAGIRVLEKCGFQACESVHGQDAVAFRFEPTSNKAIAAA